LKPDTGSASPHNAREPGAPALGGGVSLCAPYLGGNEAAYIEECLRTNFVSSVGPFVGRFERAMAEYLGVGHAVATVNGTAALHIALLMAGVKAGDEVIVSTLTFIAPVNAIRYVGAWPVFVDAEAEYFQMDVARLQEFLEERCEPNGGVLRNRATGRRVAAIIPVHVLGHPVDMEPLLAFARRYHLPVIEDATESLGARYKGAMVGTLGDAGCLSFNGNKLITTGGGGMIVSNDGALAARARYVSTQAKDDPTEFVHGTVGYNYRLSNVAAAMGCAQLERIGDHLASKRRIARLYDEHFARIPGVRPMREAPFAESAFWLYTILLDAGRFPDGSRPLMRALEARGIQARPLWQPVHLSPAHAPNDAICPVAEHLNRQALSLPSSVGLSQADQERVVDAARACLSSAE
jgi:perosamine synthetase